MKKLSIGLVVFILIFSFVSFSTSESVNPELTIEKTSRPPRINGIFNQDEWGEKLFTIADGEEHVLVYGENERTDTFTADVYLLWDERNLYVAAVAEYEDHKNDNPPDEIWKEDCLQIAIGPEWEEADYLRNEFGFALSTDHLEAIGHKWITIFHNPGPFVEGAFEIQREGNITVYEIVIPWEAISDKTSYEIGDRISFAAAFTMGRDEVFSGLEYLSAIIMEKDATNGAIVTLGELREEPGLSPSVITAIIVAVIIIAAVAALLFRKKQKNKN